VSWTLDSWKSGLGKFALVGSIGFLADAGVLTLLVSVFDGGVYSSRIMSFSVAVTITWILNKNFTFYQPDTPNFSKTYVYYILIQVTGSIVNLGIYALMLSAFKSLAASPVIALAIGSAVAMLSNYSLSRKFVFNAK